MPNLTLTLDAEVLQRARVRAVQEGTSVNAVVREYLRSYGGVDEVDEARRRLVDLSRRTAGGSGPTGRRWSRDELHAR